MDYNPPGEMECGERKRRRKSRSFKLVTDEDYDPSNMMNSSGKDVTGEPKVAAAVSDVWLADEGVEIKRQITGMMRLLRDKSSRVYQRTEAEQDCVTEEPQDGCQDSEHKTAPLCLGSDDHQSNSWDCAGDIEASPSSGSTTVSKGPGCGQYSTHSKALRIQNNKYLLNILKVNEAKDAVPPAVPETPCCMCNCKGTLQAILQELRTVRRMMHAQKASVERQEQAASPCQPRLGPGPASCCRPRKWRPFYKVAPLSVSSTRRAAVSPLEASPLISAPAGTGNREECEKEQRSTSATNHPIPTEVSVPPLQNNSMTLNHSQSPPLNQLREPQSLEVRLAKDYDVFISKPQLDSILINYTRSGSLLFRKLVCAFFDDTTLANSLPNGKRKRGLNDHRKGLDQNIVGAIKVFTEKYCTEHRIEKLPGPRDWVQILQDQIKLARRRLKRDAVDAEEALNAPSTSCDYTKPTTVKGMAVNTT